MQSALSVCKKRSLQPSMQGILFFRGSVLKLLVTSRQTPESPEGLAPFVVDSLLLYLNSVNLQ